MDKVTLVKREISAARWAEQINACQSSGLSVSAWCRENEIKPKSYYYHLRKLREKACEQLPVAIAPLPEQSTATAVAVTVRDASGLTVGITDGTSPETIAAVIRALKC